VAERLALRKAEEAIHHLFRVAGSLDSLMVGEDQILHQVREAYGRASDVGLVGSLLGPLFHHALSVGKQVRSETDLARHPVSVVNLAVHALQDDGRPEKQRLAVLGAGEMGALLVRALSAAGLAPAYVVNRSVARAEPLARACGGEALSLEDFRRGAHPVDAIVAATSAPGHVLDADLLRRLAAATPSGEVLLGVDLAVPRDLPDVDEERCRILDLDDLRAVAARHKALRAQAAAAAEQLVERKVVVFTRRFREEAAAPLVSEVRQAGEELLQRELAGLLGGRLSHLPDADRRAVERWARATFGRLMHMPTAALKRLAFEMGRGEAFLVDGTPDEGGPSDPRRDAPGPAPSSGGRS
jgi:glutamyl-tRNA reductase